MILSDKDIIKALNEKRIKIEPLDIKEQVKSVCVDLKLGNEFKLFKINHKSHIDPSSDNIGNITESVYVKDGEYFIIHPNEFVLGVTKESIELPKDIAARIDGRSSLARMGIIVHSTAGRVDPGFSGKLTLEISNIGRLPVYIYPGMRFCSLVFELISSQVEKDYKKIGKYSGFTSPMETKIQEEFKV
ncbi:MAG: dCTP deaminase [Candidatus Aenigmatarchaeota archaeon]|nr:dCTP deaminase [Candidatus Aenigmarchaeota archaeon]